MSITDKTENSVLAGEADAMQRSALENVKGVQDALTVKRVFDEPRWVDGVTVIPVARVAGGAGAGGGEGTNEDDGSGSGFGTGFGLRAVPVGAYEIRDEQLTWKPVVDVNSLAQMGVVLAGIVTVCATAIAWRRTRRL